MDLTLNKPGAVILAGGQSRRMGQNKALMEVVPGGPRLIELVLAAVRPLAAGRIVISTNRPEDFEWLGLPLVPDNFAGQGPLAGLEAGLTASAAVYNLVLACDMPFIKTAVLNRLLDEIQPGVQAVVPLNQNGRPEPLCAVYSRECLPVIRRYLESGSLKMTGWLDEVQTCYLKVEQLGEIDPQGSSFNNLNTPLDLQQAKNASGLLG